MEQQQWVGIDVCQKYLDVYIRPMGELFQVTNDEFGDESSRQLQDLVQRRRQLSDMITAEKNRLRGKSNLVQSDIKEDIAWLEEKLKEIELQIKNEIASTEDWKEKKQNLGW